MQNELPKCFTPLSSTVLSEIDYACADVASMLTAHQNEIGRLAEQVQLLDANEARRINCTLQVQNIQKSALAISNYLSISDMLLEHIRQDLNHIYRERQEFETAYRKNLARMEERNAKELDAARKREEYERQKAAEQAAAET